ncbi:MAG: hypothetical protein QXN71_01880 [Candidatus Aenigmatarchaeota archaeon]
MEVGEADFSVTVVLDTSHEAKLMFGWIGTIVGILLLLFAAFMIFFFPAAEEHQPRGVDVNGVVFGFIAGLLGIALIFLP